MTWLATVVSHILGVYRCEVTVVHPDGRFAACQGFSTVETEPHPCPIHKEMYQCR